MKSLRESILDANYDIKDPSTCAQRVFELLTSSKCQHLDCTPISWTLLYNFPIQDNFRDIFAKYGKKISATTARKKQNAAVCMMLKPSMAQFYNDHLDINYRVLEITLKLKGRTFKIQDVGRSSDWTYGIMYDRYHRDIKYSSVRGDYEYYEIPEDVADVVYKEFEYFQYIKFD